MESKTPTPQSDQSEMSGDELLGYLMEEIKRLKEVEADMDWLFRGYAVVRWEQQNSPVGSSDPIFYEQREIRDARNEEEP